MISTKCDIWSFGATIIELLTGNPPFGDEEPAFAIEQICKGDLRDQIPPKISADLQQLLQLCFKKNASERPDTEQLQTKHWIMSAVSRKINISRFFF